VEGRGFSRAATGATIKCPPIGGNNSIRYFLKCGESCSFSSQLRFNHFAAAQAGCANSNALGSAFHPSVNRTQIYIPAPLGHVMGVTDVISKLRPLAAKIAYLCH
jgi:hypothetical protein